MIDASRLSEIESAIKIHFPLCSALRSCTQVQAGVNSVRHFVCLDESGQRFGLKLALRIDGGVEKEKLAADIAELLGIANACKVRQTIELPVLDEHQGLSVNVTHWLKDGKAVAEMTDEERQQVQSAPVEFLLQLGQWAAFGLLLGIADRHLGNFAWSAECGLAMIDLEDLFQFVSIGEYCTLVHFVFEQKLSAVDKTHITDGFERTLTGCQLHNAEIQELIDKSFPGSLMRPIEPLRQSLIEALDQI